MAQTLTAPREAAATAPPPLPATPSPVTSRPARLTTRRALVALLLGAVALRLVLLDRSLWLDELITVLKARESTATLLEGLADDVHPPLYYLLLHGWVALFGSAEVVIRAPSVLWSLVTVCAVWAWSREALPERSPLPAAALAALSPFAVWYATEVRMYAQILALTALAGWLAYRAMGRGPRPLELAALGACLVALVWTHYFGALFLGALGVVAFAVVLWRPASRPAAAWVCVLCVLALASLAPWGAFVLEHRSAVSPDPTRYPAPNFYSVVIADLQMLMGFVSFDLVGRLSALWPLSGLLAIALLPAMRVVRWPVAGLLALAALPAAVLVAVSVLGPRSAFDARFLAVCAVPLYLLGGALLAGLPRRALAGLGSVLMLAAVLGALWQNSSSANPKLYDYAGALEHVNAVARPGDAVLLLPNFSAAGNAGEPIYGYYQLRPGVRAIDTRRIVQGSPQATRRTLATVWESVVRARPERVFVIDGFATHGGGRASSAAARRFLTAQGPREGVVPFAQAAVHVYRPAWAAR